jgi:hypothetical protein
MKPMNLAEVKGLLELLVYALRKKIIEERVFHRFVELIAIESHYATSDILDLAKIIHAQYMREPEI